MRPRKLVPSILAGVFLAVTSAATFAGLPSQPAAAAPVPTQTAAQLYCSVPAEVTGYFGPDSDTWRVNGVSDSTLVYVGHACQQHDICYSGLPNVSRLECDDIFVRNLRNICFSHFDVGGPFTKQSHCLGFSSDYYKAVRHFGYRAYHGPITN